MKDWIKQPFLPFTIVHMLKLNRKPAAVYNSKLASTLKPNLLSSVAAAVHWLGTNWIQEQH